MYSEFRVRGIKSEFYHAVSEVIRYTLANVLVNDSNCVRINDFIGNLGYLCENNKNRGILPDYFCLQDVEDIQNRIDVKIGNKREKEIKKFKKEL